jgi:hypothetical protein
LPPLEVYLPLRGKKDSAHRFSLIKRDLRAGPADVEKNVGIRNAR